MQYAVKSFATRSLDEWVLDYPQQVVLTTLRLVLSNEINDILEERQRLREIAEAEGSENDNPDLGDDGDDGADEEHEGKEEGAGEEDNKKKPAGEQAKEAEKAAPIEDNMAPGARRVLKGTAQIKRAPAEEKDRFLKELFGKDF